MPPNSILYFELELVDIGEGTKIDVFSHMDTDRDGKLTGEIFWKHHILKHLAGSICADLSSKQMGG